MQDIWQRFIEALVFYSPTLVTRLNPGVDDGTILRAEQRLGVFFTEEVKEFFHLQNGSNGPLFGSWAFLSLDEMCEDWLTMKEKFPSPIPPDDDAYYSWNENWLPLLRASPFMRVYIRIDPQEEVSNVWDQSFAFHYGGKISHERLGTLFLSTSRADFVATSINEFVENLICALEQKEYVYDKDIQSLRTLDSMTSRLRRVNEPDFYQLDADFPEVEMSFGDRVAYPGLCCLPSRREYTELFSLFEQRTVTQSWEMFRASIERMAPEMLNGFGDGVSIAALQRIEEQMQMRFPDDFKAWYSFCNGTTWMYEEGVQGSIDCWEWYSLEHLFQRWKFFQEWDGSRPITGKYLMSADPRIQQVWWHPQWIPFMWNGDSSVLCIDLAPTATGKTGQIILLIYKSMLYGSPLDMRRIPPVVWIAPNLGRFLAVFAQDLSEGRYSFDKKSKMFWSQEGLAYVEDDENLRFLLELRCENIQGK